MKREHCSNLDKKKMSAITGLFGKLLNQSYPKKLSLIKK